MALSKDQVVVLKSTNYSEADKILTVFGRQNGKFTLFAKGVRKIESKNRGNIQTLSVADITFYEGRNMATLRESSNVVATLIEGSDFELAQKLIYMLNKLLPEHENENKIYDLLVNLLDGGLNKRSLNSFRMRFLKELGYMPDFSSCAICGQNQGKYFVPSDMHLICEVCKAASEIKSYPLEKSRFESAIMSNALDNFIEKIVENT